MIGFETAVDGMRGGFGIPGRQERSQRIGGTLQIVSAPGKGTSVIIRVPVNPSSLTQDKLPGGQFNLDKDRIQEYPDVTLSLQTSKMRR